MSAIIAMVVYCTETNNKDEYLEKSLASIRATVDTDKYKLYLSVNSFTARTVDIIERMFPDIIERVIYNRANIGTAKALNKVIALRKPGQNVIKMDEDIVIYDAGWVDKMEAAIEREPRIGVIGLKRNDLIQCPTYEDPHFRSKLVMLPQERGQRFIVVERAGDIIGSCTMFNSALLDKVGYSWQPGVYGFEDNLMCHRSHLAGFYNCFLSNVYIDHVDNGGGEFQAFKQSRADEANDTFIKSVHEMIAGTRPIYYDMAND